MWFGSTIVAGICVIPAFIGALAGAFGGTVNAKVLAGVASQRGASPSAGFPLSPYDLLTAVASDDDTAILSLMRTGKSTVTFPP